jgi:hypothetical protein
MRDHPMTKKARGDNNFVDALERDHRYAVLTKKGRIQILVQPTSKQLRKRGKRGWELHGIVDDGQEPDRMLMEMIQEAIRAEMKGAVDTADKDDSAVSASNNRGKH